MRVLTVCSGNTSTRPDGTFDLMQARPFVAEQVRELEKLGVEEGLFLIQGQGVKGYLSNLAPLKKRLEEGAYDLVHAHFGLSGFVSVLQRRTPVVVTFHGCDVNVRRNNVISTAASLGANWRIFVSEKMHRKMLVPPREAYSVVPCGVNLDLFAPVSQAEARAQLGLDQDKSYVLFASSFGEPVKNYPLARDAVSRLEGDVELLELRGYTRQQVALLLSACDLLLLTSLREGSPQVVKEAMGCNCPVVSTDVGDVREVLRGVEGCHVTSYDPAEVASRIAEVLSRGRRTEGRERVAHLDNAHVAAQVLDIYERVLDGAPVTEASTVAALARG